MINSSYSFDSNLLSFSLLLLLPTCWNFDLPTSSCDPSYLSPPLSLCICLVFFLFLISLHPPPLFSDLDSRWFVFFFSKSFLGSYHDSTTDLSPTDSLSPTMCCLLTFSLSFLSSSFFCFRLDVIMLSP